MSQMPNENQNAAAPQGAGTPGTPGSEPPQELARPENNEAKTMGMLCHLLGIFTSFVGPLIIWLTKKDQSKFVDQQGKEALNFQLTMLIGFIAGGITSCIGIGFIILPAVQVVSLIFGILATVEANKGNPYRYPICIRFIK